MCGIVGYLGKDKDPKEIVLEGLNRLEYRGYDSAGICFKTLDGTLEYFKKVGKLENLREFIKDKEIKSDGAIGHTRWATHGKVTEFNAHPHLSDNIAIVHNGIIENFEELKEDLIKAGEKFESETDSEVFTVLLNSFLKKGEEILPAIARAFKKIRGNSSFLILDNNSDSLYTIKKSAPMVCGLNTVTLEMLASSDPYAMVGWVDELYFPEDEVITRLSLKGGIEFFDFDLSPTNRYEKKKQNLSAQVQSKEEFEHFMLKEIHEQPSLIRSTLGFYLHGDGKDLLAALPNLKQANRVHLVACGTAWHAGLLIKDFLEKNNKIICNIELASEFRYGEPLLLENDIGLFISQSGETADTLAAQELCKKRGLKTLSIVNVEGSTLFRNCDANLLLKAGQEIGVASTKAYTQMVLVGYILSQHLLGQLNSDENKLAFEKLAFNFDDVLRRQSAIREIAEELYNKKGYIFTGRGPYFHVALEGALKLKEIAYVHAEGYAAGELKHGPIALIDENMVNVAIVAPSLYEKTVSNVHEVRARKGIVFAIVPADEKDNKYADYIFKVGFNETNDLSSLLTNLTLQLFAYYLAHFKGTDIDKPRNLAKSVTVE